MLELRHLRYFIALARQQNFTRAARDLHIAQPALSMQIRQLEEHLRTTLVERGKRSVQLTDAGRTFLRRAEKVLSEIRLAEAEMLHLNNFQGGRLLVGALPLLGEFFFKEIFLSFSNTYPNVDFSYIEQSNEKLCAALHERELDAAFIDIALCPPETLRGLTVIELFRADAVVLMAPVHRLAGRKAVGAPDLVGERLIRFSEGSTVRHAAMKDFCRERGIDIPVSYQAGQIRLVRQLVSQGMGVAVMPSWIVRTDGPPVAAAKLVAPATDFRVAIAWVETNIEPRTLAFSALMQEQIIPAAAGLQSA